jgi:hypothetical protein
VEQVDLSQVPHEVHIVKGQPYEVISGFASQSDIAVLGTLSRGGVEGLLIGNTAELILRRIDCSVLAVKPEGFQTPLQFEEAKVGAEACPAIRCRRARRSAERRRERKVRAPGPMGTSMPGLATGFEPQKDPLLRSTQRFNLLSVRALVVLMTLVIVWNVADVIWVL